MLRTGLRSTLSCDKELQRAIDYDKDSKICTNSKISARMSLKDLLAFDRHDQQWEREEYDEGGEKMTFVKAR